ncbi:hypothetical protein ACFV1L_10565 [Kitasatospora sp. NPDC059646]|uniref:hypothetical protein n=1 Tax=Kitasatospora sp. NPDC059646 TaxID=3346893 RepID=UPI0036C2A498
MTTRTPKTVRAVDEAPVWVRDVLSAHPGHSVAELLEGAGLMIRAAEWLSREPSVHWAEPEDFAAGLDALEGAFSHGAQIIAAIEQLTAQHPMRKEARRAGDADHVGLFVKYAHDGAEIAQRGLRPAQAAVRNLSSELP